MKMLGVVDQRDVYYRFLLLNNQYVLIAVFVFKNINMRSDEKRSKLQMVKEQLFDFIFVLDTNQLASPILQVGMIVLQLSFLHYFYISSNFSFLASHRFFQAYFQNFQSYFVHINAFNNATLALLTLLLYPIVILITLIIKKIGPNKIFGPIVQIAIFIYPLLQIKIAIQFISACVIGKYLYLVFPLGILSFAFGGILMIISNKTYRMMEYPLILMIELKANIYLVLVSLAIRLIIVGYLLYPSNRNLLGFFYECALFAIVITSNFCDDQFLNYIGFLFLVLNCLVTGGRQSIITFNQNRNILDYADKLDEEDDQGSIYEVYKRIEMHYVDCEIVDCLCQTFYEIEREGLVEWVYRFEEERLRRRESFGGRYEYAARCESHYEFRLSGLVRVCQGKPRSIMEEYKVFKVCSLYQLNLRKQDKNYRYGEPYRNAQEQLQTFQLQISKILHQIRKFWTLITNFDGSTKFLYEILLISRTINHLNKQYKLYETKYDEELKEFKYVYQVFLSIILNEEIIEEDEMIVPEPTSFLITNGQKILNANNSFLLLSSQSLDTLIGSSYHSLIPDVYRDIHNKWAADFIEKVEDYEGKSIGKCLRVGNIQIRMVEMQHKVLPRFLQGLQIYTTVKPVNTHRREKKESFIFLVEKQTFFIKNVESTFFDIIKFKVNQRNFKLLQEMSLTSVFQNFSVIHSENPARQVMIFPHFLQEFTHLKAKKKTHRKSKSVGNSRSSYLAGHQTKTNTIGQYQQIFDFAILPNARSEDPYIKVQFTLKQEKQEDVVTSQQESSSPNIEGEQQNQPNKPKKQDNFGYFIPYYLVATLGLCHIFFILGKSNFNNALLDLHNRYLFYLDFDYTTLSVLSAWTGIDKTQELRNLWITGYGGFSESFNAFRRVNDSYFLNYFNTQISNSFHNQLYDKTQALISGSLNSMNFYQVSILVIVFLAIGNYIFDFILSLRYTFFIESKVGAMLLQFVTIESRDVQEILLMISNFQSNVLNIQEDYKNLKVPLETVEQSALQLMKGGMSLNNSMALQNEQVETPTEKKHLPHRKKTSSYEDRERVSLSMLKSEFRINEKSGFKKQLASREQYSGDKNRNINLFKRKYRNCLFIINANRLLYFLIFLGFVINIGIIGASVSTSYTPFNYLPIHLKILDSLQQSRVILLKSQTQILTNTTLSPNISLSNSLLSVINLMGSLSSNSATSSFNAKLSVFLTDDACGAVDFNCSLLAGDNNLHKYGIKVMVQYVEDYFRKQNKTMIRTKNLQNQLIVYLQILYTSLITEFLVDSQRFCSDVQSAELKILIIGSLGLLFGMVLVHYSLRQFKNRIQNSQNLLKIIPKEIKKKQQKDIEQLTLKELSTP